jgi:hypothetical protein
MSTYTSEPGTRLAGRYLLVDQLSAGASWMYWKATDETLARPVTVLTFALGFSRLAEAVTAARAASRLTDPRFAQVFDVEDADDLAYVVMEWVVGESLLDMLAEGPLDPPRAAALMLEAAQALATAHAAGLAHLRLSPACLHWTPGGGVKISGLGIEAALTPAEDAEDAQGPELADTRGLARLLYAALTGYWPGPAGPLPPAPLTDQQVPCTPRQVSAAVPANIDAVTCQALFQRPSRHGPALTTPAMLADALAEVAPRYRLPIPDLPVAATRAVPGGYPATGPTNPYPAAPATRADSGYRRPPRRRSTATWAVIGAVIVVVLAAVGVALSLSHGTHGPTAAQTTPGHSPTPTAAAAVVLKPVSATSFDPYGSGGGEDPGQVQNVIDGAGATTPWHTSYYLGYPTFGNLKKGTGILLDMGKEVRLSQVAVQFGTRCCAHVQIAIGNSNSALSAFTELQSSDHAAGLTTFTVTSATTGRYVLIWLTYLPANGTPGQYQAFVYNVSVRGAVASQSG